MEAPVGAGQRPTIISDESNFVALPRNHFFTVSRTDRQIGCPWWGSLSERCTSDERTINRSLDTPKQRFTPDRKTLVGVRCGSKFFTCGNSRLPACLKQLDNVPFNALEGVILHAANID